MVALLQRDWSRATLRQCGWRHDRDRGGEDGAVSDADRERWDARHAAAGPAVPAPPGAFAGAADLTTSVPTTGRALDVACGRGAVAVWLALRGLAVNAVDVAPAGLAAGKALADACGVADRIRWIAHDLDGGLPAGPAYDVVVCQLFRDPGLYGALAAALTPGGLLAVTVLSEVGAAPGPFRAHPGELQAAFAGLDVLLERESDGEATLLARAPQG
jgi:SAM-dependent methyltransferase